MHRYDIEIDPAEDNNSHAFMLELVGGNKRVLDVGCASGYLARALRARGCQVSGVESDPELAEQARPALDRLVVADVEGTDLVGTFGERRFDVVVFGDVLEHLRDPLAVLRQARPLLDDGGSVVASVPNVAHGSVRLSLLRGRFDYQSLGLLDNTHLRFFTRESLERLLGDAGLAPVELRRTTAGLFDTHVRLDPDDYPPEIVEAVLADPEALTYQFVLRAVADDAGAAVARLHAQVESLRRRIPELESAAEDSQDRVEDLRRRLAESEASAERLACELHAARDELARVMSSRTMRWTRPARLAYGRLREGLD